MNFWDLDAGKICGKVEGKVCPGGAGDGGRGELVGQAVAVDSQVFSMAFISTVWSVCGCPF